MDISNQKRAKRIKRTFNYVAITIIVIGLLFLILGMEGSAWISVGILVMYIIVSIYIDYYFVSFSNTDGKITIKYFPIITFMKKDYEIIEFPQNTLFGFKIEKSLGLSDLSLAIKTKRGIAEYPSISLSALNKSEIQQIDAVLNEILKDKIRNQRIKK